MTSHTTAAFAAYQEDLTLDEAQLWLNSELVDYPVAKLTHADRVWGRIVAHNTGYRRRDTLTLNVHVLGVVGPLTSIHVPNYSGFFSKEDISLCLTQWQETITAIYNEMHGSTTL